MTFVRFLLSCLCMVSSCLSARCIWEEEIMLCEDNDETYLSFVAGLQTNRLKCDVDLFGPTGLFVVNDTIDIDHWTCYTVGFKGKYSQPCTSWYVRADGDFGSNQGRGRYTETFSAPPPATTTIVVADIRRGTAWDFTAGLGYLFDLSSCWGVAPVIGYSYNYQRIKIDMPPLDILSRPVFINIIFNRAEFTNTWQGPWLGVDFVFNNHCFIMNAGYEFHWAHWNAAWIPRIQDEALFVFRDHRSGNNALGQVGFIEWRWGIGDWVVGLGMKGQYWRVTNGNLSPAGVGPIASGKVREATWIAGSLNLSLGMEF